MKLALGSVQFGLPYGIANSGGQVPQSTAAAILDYARDCGIDTIDTAIGYGESEEVLGRIGIADFRVITKLPAVPVHHADVYSWMMEQVVASLRRLRVDRLGGLLLHRPEQLLEARGEAIAEALLKTKQLGLADKIGVSIYAPDALTELLAACPIDIVQAPYNLVDRRIAASGWLERLKANHVEVHVRSIFLQGLLLMPSARRPPQFGRWSELWRRWDHWLESQQVDAASACIGFVESSGLVDRLVIGVDGLDQFKALVRASQHPVVADLPDLACDADELINPATWSRT